jgi:hypothetical protein
MFLHTSQIIKEVIFMKKLMLLFVAVLFFLANAATVSAEEEIIKLPAPQTEGGIPLMKALSLRKSTRGILARLLNLPCSRCQTCCGQLMA